ncbi:MAG: phosphatase PAP2 family protein [Oscillospiraceae bacterium]|nr:phosphatase PAP2 family protein [Oscillospiraceae bacterium]
MDVLSYLAENFDLPILEWIAENLYCGFLDAVMPIITLLGDAGIFWIAVAVVLLFFPKYRKIGLSMGAALIMGLLVCNVTLKPLIARPRPYDYQLEHFGKAVELLIATPHDFSFPSGHTLASFEAATVLLIRNRKMGIPAMILACLIAFSRMYLYVHYPTDVLFSVVLGIGFAFLGTYLVDKAYAHFTKKN